ncbi:hypothetical protein [Methylophaga sp. UBA2012]|nr:hypothetical protein [Methylophaga sp. UBA2012]HIC47875.1 hypothetical protein [Methylophaga sp.]
MSMKYKLFLVIGMFLTMTHVFADCIVTNNNFSKSSKIIFVNPNNGSDQLAKTYSLDNVRNPYEADGVAAFQSIEKAKSLANSSKGDLILIKAGRQWTNYEAWEENKLSDFNKEVMKASGMSERQCRGDSLTWVPSSVNDNQLVQTPGTTDFVTNNNDDVTLARTEETAPIRLPGISSTNTTSRDSSASSARSSSSGSTSSRGSTSGGRSSSTSNETAQTSNQSLLTDVTTNTSSRSKTSNTRLVVADNLTNNSEGQQSTSDDSATGNIVDTVNDIGQNLGLVDCEANAPWRSAIQTYPQDSNGWSVITPDTETRIVYVSSTEGNDSTAKTYLSAELDDPFNPKNIQPYKTFEEAYKQIRNDKPDWILLKKGDVFKLQNTIWLRSGKSQSAHLVFGAYGDTHLKRPVIDSFTFDAMRGIKNRSFITIFGLDFYASGRDPKSNRFVGWGGALDSSVAISTTAGALVQGIHIENNRFNYFGSNIGFGAMSTGVFQNVVIRRNEIINSFSTTKHAQGLFLSQVNFGLIEENIFDHNGWYQQRPSSVALNTKDYGYATFFNHNVYIHNSTNLIIQKNLSSRSSSIGMKFASNSDAAKSIDTVNSYNILLDKNVITEGEVGFSIGGNRDFNNGYRWDNIQLINNVLTNIGRTEPTNRGLAFNIEVNDWQSGTVCGNVVSDTAASLSNVYGLQVKGHIRDIDVRNNSFINLGIAQDKSVLDSAENISGDNNTYIAKLDNTNFLDIYVATKGFGSYQQYIQSVLEKLQNNPESYFDVDEIINYYKNSALSVKEPLVSKE